MPRTKVDLTGYKYRRFNDYVRGELKRKHKSQEMLANYLNMKRPSLTLRLLGKVEWTFREVLDTLEYLETEITEIF